MSRKMTFWVLLFGLSLCSTTRILALDGKRKGFIIGIGAGGGLASYKSKVELSSGNDFEGDRMNKFGIMTDFKLGYAPSNQVAIFWTSKVAWFSQKIEGDPRFGIEDQSFIIANGMGGLGFAYYLQPDGPSLYLTGGLGFSSWATPFEEGSEASYGLGLSLGAGLEFSKHWSIEGNLVLGSPDEEFSGARSSVNTLGVRVTINRLGY